ncbi:hypothetical protein, partial [Streptomyces sp. NPDC058739]|uniref:hypothetical protein n=1 Tax=Streptomyces sp. NPDC058739 TaxID=3346618 RepID=UPI0036CE1550
VGDVGAAAPRGAGNCAYGHTTAAPGGGGEDALTPGAGGRRGGSRLKGRGELRADPAPERRTPGPA